MKDVRAGENQTRRMKKDIIIMKIRILFSLVAFVYINLSNSSVFHNGNLLLGFYPSIHSFIRTSSFWDEACVLKYFEDFRLKCS